MVPQAGLTIATTEDCYHATAVDTNEHVARCVTCIDLNMVRAGAVGHPREWYEAGYREIQQAPKRYGIIHLAALCELVGIAEQQLAAVHNEWIESTLARGNLEREPQWSEAVAVGRRGNPLDLLRASSVRVRDIFRQTIADQMALVRAIRAGIDLDGDAGVDLDAGDVGYLGVSLGGILGATFVAVEDDVRTAVLNVAGGRVAFLGDSPGTRGIFAGDLASRVNLDVEDPYFETFLQRMLELGQQAFDSMDGLNFARRWVLEPFPGAAPRRVLLQEGIGDLLVPNASTEALAAAGGLIANTPMSDPAGVSGLWRFDPPGGHGILQRDDVFTQAGTFLESRGTEIIDPAPVVSRTVH